MATEREFQEMIARCVSLMVYYHNVAQSRREHTRMTAEVQAVARWAKALGLGQKGSADCLLRPLEAELIVRYGPEEGGRLNRDFIRAFKDNGDRDQPSGLGNEILTGLSTVIL